MEKRLIDGEEPNLAAPDYESFIEFLRWEPDPPQSVYYLDEFSHHYPDKVPEFPPACRSKCFVSAEGSFFWAQGQKGHWSFGDGGIEDSGVRFELDRESATLISRLCHILAHPPMHAGVSSIRDLCLFVGGMREALPYKPGSDYAFETLVDDTWDTVLAITGKGSVHELLRSEAEKGKDDRCDCVRAWRSAFRENLLFIHPEIGLTYAAYMGARGLYSFTVLLEKEWFWRAEGEGENAIQREMRLNPLERFFGASPTDCDSRWTRRKTKED